jgi:rsbT co-antagonist protein RsbR
MHTPSRLHTVIQKHEDSLLADWTAQQSKLVRRTMSPSEEKHLAGQCREFLSSLRLATADGGSNEISRAEWTAMRSFLANLSAARAKAGSSPVETAML